ncbi:DUF397 domain-containing protein [Sphaerisporangium sp. B11E5]|uniref:DUF397 domain-containing protein n=1 Tax=Sphaerisporangium sp. B11E5 TaxID=3153563 RepID=UPI00325D4D8A
MCEPYISRAEWRKSRYSGGNGGSCVEVAGLPDGGYAIRDSKRVDGPILRVTADEWAVFMRHLRSRFADVAGTIPGFTVAVDVEASRDSWR